VFGWCPVKDELFRLADVVVARAGHSTIGQCINNGKPAVLVPIHNHPEQIGNADKFCKLGLGKEIRSEKLTSENLPAAIRECLGDQGYRRKAEEVRRVSDRYDGVQRTAEIVRSYC
jgi:UDP:flavonoid glycosyltransferase YjiC (YdhE family)